MGKDTAEKGKREVSPRDRAQQAFGQAWSNVAGFVNGGATASNAVRVVCRGQYDFLAVASRVDGAGIRFVCFGNGESFFGAVDALNRAMAADAWKVDRFQPGG